MLRPPRSSSAPGTPLRNQFVAALLGAAGFRSRWGRLALQHHLGGGWCCLHQVGGRFRGARFLGRAVGPIRTGDRPPECAVCGEWRRSRTMEAGSRGDQTAGKDRFTMQHARTGQMRMREARSRVPHVTSRQDSIYNVRPMSTVHRSPTINPHYPLMFLPLRPGPVIKYRDFRRP